MPNMWNSSYFLISWYKFVDVSLFFDFFCLFSVVALDCIRTLSLSTNIKYIWISIWNGYCVISYRKWTNEEEEHAIDKQNFALRKHLRDVKLNICE